MVRGEQKQIFGQDVSFDEVGLLPSMMKSLKVLSGFSSELARQFVVALDAALKDRLVRDVATKLDSQLFSASGTTSPRGMLAWTGTQTLAVGGRLTLDHLQDAEGMISRPTSTPVRATTTALRHGQSCRGW